VLFLFLSRSCQLLLLDALCSFSLLHESGQLSDLTREPVLRVLPLSLGRKGL